MILAAEAAALNLPARLAEEIMQRVIRERGTRTWSP